MKPRKEKGLFITIEGIEGVGKSSAVQCLREYFQVHQVSPIFTREPGGTEIAEAIRQILLHKHEELMSCDTELLLMFAGRAQHIAKTILPALQAGKVVVSDRFTDATYAYQGGGRGIAEERIKILEQWVQGDLQPDLTLLLDAPIELGLQRISVRGQRDRIEQEQIEFFHRVRAAYLLRAKQFPERFKIIDATKPISEVQEVICDTVAGLLQT